MQTLFADTDAQTEEIAAAIDVLRRQLNGETPEAGDRRAVAEALLGETLSVGIVETQAELARLWREQVGDISDRQVRNWAQNDGWPGGDGVYPLLAIAYHLGQQKTRGGRKKSEEKTQLELERLQLDVAQRRRLNDEATGTTIPIEDVDKLFTATQLEAKTALSRIPLAAKAIEALDGQLLRQELEKLVRQVMDTLYSGEHAERAADKVDAIYALADTVRAHAAAQPPEVLAALEALDVA